MNQGLLPSGLYDTLPPKAFTRMKMVYELLNRLHEQGFEIVDPPLVEFEETLFWGQGRALENQSFRVLDPVSGKMMAIRSDITVQIARIAATRFKKQSLPLKLAYAGPVLQTTGDKIYKQRQRWQAGIEFIGPNNAEANLQIISQALISLIKSGVDEDKLCIDFTIPGLIHAILEKLDINQLDLPELLQALDQKDQSTIARLLHGEIPDIITQSLHLSIDLQSLQSLDIPKVKQEACNQLTALGNQLSQDFPKLSISVDLLDSLKFQYHHDLGFTIFAQGSKSELARGGRYIIEKDDGNLDAVGATFYINELMRYLS